MSAELFTGEAVVKMRRPTAEYPEPGWLDGAIEQASPARSLP